MRGSLQMRYAAMVSLNLHRDACNKEAEFMTVGKWLGANIEKGAQGRPFTPFLKKRVPLTALVTREVDVDSHQQHVLEFFTKLAEHHLTEDLPVMLIKCNDNECFDQLIAFRDEKGVVHILLLDEKNWDEKWWRRNGGASAVENRCSWTADGFFSQAKYVLTDLIGASKVEVAVRGGSLKQKGGGGRPAA